MEHRIYSQISPHATPELTKQRSPNPTSSKRTQIPISETNSSYPYLKNAPPANAIDGWTPGTDPKISSSAHLEFGGPWGVTAMMLLFPPLMFYMYIGSTYNSGHLPLPSPSQSIPSFLAHLLTLIHQHAFPSLRAWTMYWTFIIFQAACYCLMPGIWGSGKPIAYLGGKQLRYYSSAVWSFYSTIVVLAVLHWSRIFPLQTILAEFGPLLSVSIISGFAVSIMAYASTVWRGAQHRMSGYFIYDFWMGAEHNPRMFNGLLDLKVFFMMRLPWPFLFFLAAAVAAKQKEEYGYVSLEVWFLVMAFFLYANACAKGEELCITTWDIYYEKWGFMLIFWNLAGVPFTYCNSIWHVANHLDTITDWRYPALRKPILTALFISYLFAYWIWDTTGSQKNRFRAQERGDHTIRKTYPRLPWATLTNPRVIKTATGDSILVDGWYKYARKIHYTCDIFFALSWGGITGFASPFPWFYPVFFVAMILHRAYRDVERCRAKYGESWAEFEKAVPYMWIPYII